MAASAMMAFCALVVVGIAQNHPETISTQTAQPSSPPYWAFTVNPPAGASNQAEPANHDLQRVPNSSAAFTVTQVHDLFSAPDWHAAGHPPMPDVVAHGRKPDVFACGYCHLPNGQGRPENASLAGLPAAYIVQQMADFKSGLRKSSEPQLMPVALMISRETQAEEKEIQDAAEYFSALKPKPWIHVIETRTVPKTHVAGWMLVRSVPAATEPIGRRIIETPVNLERTELRDDASPFIAYVPIGNVKRGRDLVTTGGGGKTIPCATCHGVNLRGNDNVPSIAGRSPSYIVRQLYDIQSGSRRGAGAALMKAPVANLTIDDMVSIAAYTSSLHP
jgi:cytochrome c553